MYRRIVETLQLKRLNYLGIIGDEYLPVLTFPMQASGSWKRTFLKGVPGNVVAEFSRAAPPHVNLTTLTAVLLLLYVKSPEVKSVVDVIAEHMILSPRYLKLDEFHRRVIMAYRRVEDEELQELATYIKAQME